MRFYLPRWEARKKKGSKPPPTIHIISGILIALLVMDLAILGDSNRASVDMCTGCHGDRYWEYCNLTPTDGSSVLPTTFELNKTTMVKMVVTVEGSWPQNHWYNIDLLIVNLTSSSGRVIIQNPSQERYNIMPNYRSTFQWPVTGNFTGADTLTFDLYAFNGHSSQFPHINENLTVRDQYTYFTSVILPQFRATPPLNLQSSSGDGFVHLSWDPPASDGNASIIEYFIYRGTSSGGEVLVKSVSGTSFSYNDTAVMNGENYYYYITAINTVGESDPSNEISDIPLGLPTLPRNLIGEGGDRYVQLSWEDPNHDGGLPISEYRIFRGTEYGGETYFDSASPDNTSYNDTGLTNGITYYHIVTAVNSIGESPPSIGVATMPLRDVSVPSPPRNLEANTGNGFVELSWEAPEDDGGAVIMGYKIYKGNAPGNETYFDSEIGFTISHNDTTVTNGEIYYYYVTALNPLGESEPSDTIIENPQGPPEAPGLLQAETGNGYVNLTWEETGNDGGLELISYEIYRGNSSDDLVNLTSVDPANLMYNDTSVTNGVIYYYAVTAVNTVWVGESSPIIKAVPQSVPTYPRNLSATLGKGYVDISWELPVDNGGHPIMEYNIYRGSSPGTEVRIAKVNSILTIYRDPTIFKGTYFYYVTASNLVGESPNSNEVNLTLIVKEETDKTGIPKISFSYPEDENVHVNENEVVVLYVESDGNPTFDWYVDNESYATGISTLTYPILGSGGHFVRLRITNETSGLSENITWNILINKDDNEIAVSRSEGGCGFPGLIKEIVLFGGMVILLMICGYLAFFYFKKKKGSTKKFEKTPETRIQPPSDEQTFEYRSETTGVEGGNMYETPQTDHGSFFEHQGDPADNWFDDDDW